MILQTSTGQQLPNAITLSSDSDGLLLYSVDENSVPVQCYFTLTPCGPQNVNPKGNVFYGGRNSSMWNGSLNGIESRPTVNAGPAYSVQYRQPANPIVVDVPIYCTLSAIPTDGSPSRQIMITVQTSKQIF